MKTRHYLGVLAVVLLLGAVGLVRVYAAPVYLDDNRKPAKDGADCTMTVTTATVGHQESSTLLAASTNRAWARIESVENATNTYAVVLDEGTAATFATGIKLNGVFGNGTSTPHSLVFGLNTELPYTGAVTGLTDNGSTTALVYECDFD